MLYNNEIKILICANQKNKIIFIVNKMIMCAMKSKCDEREITKWANSDLLKYWWELSKQDKKMLTTEKGLHVHGFVRVMILLLCMIYSSR